MILCCTSYYEAKHIVVFTLKKREENTKKETEKI